MSYHIVQVKRIRIRKFSNTFIYCQSVNIKCHLRRRRSESKGKGKRVRGKASLINLRYNAYIHRPDHDQVNQNPSYLLEIFRRQKEKIVTKTA